MNDYDEHQIKTLVFHTQQMLHFLAIIAITTGAIAFALIVSLIVLVMT